jgi:hypothetical protein
MSDYDEDDFLDREGDDEVEVVEDEENELHFSVEGLGQLHTLDDGAKVFVVTPDTVHCLHDIQIALRDQNAGGEADSRKVDLCLSRWSVVGKQLVPLFLHHREDNKIWTGVLKLLVILTRPLGKAFPDRDEHIKFLQDYKELMSTRDMFIVLMSIITEAITTNNTVETQINEIETQIARIDDTVRPVPEPVEDNAGETQNMDAPMDETLMKLRQEEEERKVRKERKRMKELKKAEIRSLTERSKVHEKNVELVLTLVRHLLEIADPKPGMKGYTQARSTMQIQLIKYLSEEAVLDALIMFGEQVEFPKYSHLNWLFLEIFYHVCATIPPSELANYYEQLKVDLTKLLDLEKQLVYAQVPKYARHSRFATDSVLRNVQPSCGGNLADTGAVVQKAARSKFFRERKLVAAGPDGQQAQVPSLFEDPAFIDIATGTNSMPALPVSVLGSDFREFYAEIKSFIDRFLEAVFANLMKSVYVEIENEKNLHDYDLVRVVNMITWILDYQYKLMRKATNLSKQANRRGSVEDTPAPTVSVVPMPSIDNVQWALSQDALSLIAKQVKLHSREAKTIKGGGANLVVALRALLEQLKMAKILGPTSGDSFRILDSLCYDEVPRALTWTIRNFKPTVNRPEVLWYSLECVEELVKTIDKYMAHKKTTENGGRPKTIKKNKSRISRQEAELQGIEFYDHQSSSDSDVSIRSAESNDEGGEEALIDAKSGVMADMCHGEFIGNLFYVLQNFKDNPQSANDAVCAALMRITMEHQAYVAYFFQLSYLVILYNIINDPLLRAIEEERKKYSSVILITKLVIRKFVQTARVNKNVFVEILFPRTKVGRYGSLLSIETDLNSICNNYQDEETRIILERIHNGDTYEHLKAEKNERAMYGSPWTDDEEQQLIGLWEQVNGMEGRSKRDKVNMIIANTVPLEGRKKRKPKDVYHKLMKLGLIQNSEDDDGFSDQYSNSDSDYHRMDDDAASDGSRSAVSSDSDDGNDTNPRNFQDYISKVNRVKISDLMASTFDTILQADGQGLTTDEMELLGQDFLLKVSGA